MQRRVTLSDVIGWNPCWDEAKLKEYAEGRTQEDILTLLKDERLKLEDRIWLACWAMLPQECWSFAGACAKRIVDREADPKGWVYCLSTVGSLAVETVGVFVNTAMAAAMAASDESAMSASFEAARAASWSAAWSESRGDAWKAERRWQLDWIIENFLEGGKS